jgi:octanoyl-[GcvH]:protein N-octanoyltransferase
LTRFTRALVELEPAADIDAAAAIERDEVLAAEVGSGTSPPTVRIWENHAAVVLPGWRLREVTPREVTDRHGRRWPICPRASGGGTVAHGPETLNLSLILPLESMTAPSIDDGYQLWIELLADALRDAYGVAVRAAQVDAAFCKGRYDAAVDGRKLAGTAQLRRKGAVVVHGTILVNVDADDYLDVIERAEAACGIGAAHPYDRTTIVSLRDLVAGATAAGLAAALLEQMP